jgi:hypothetical protein
LLRKAKFNVSPTHVVTPLGKASPISLTLIVVKSYLPVDVLKVVSGFTVTDASHVVENAVPAPNATVLLEFIEIEVEANTPAITKAKTILTIKIRGKLSLDALSLN